MTGRYVQNNRVPPASQCIRIHLPKFPIEPVVDLNHPLVGGIAGGRASLYFQRSGACCEAVCKSSGKLLLFINAVGLLKFSHYFMRNI